MGMNEKYRTGLDSMSHIGGLLPVFQSLYDEGNKTDPFKLDPG